MGWLRRGFRMGWLRLRRAVDRRVAWIERSLLFQSEPFCNFGMNFCNVGRVAGRRARARVRGNGVV